MHGVVAFRYFEGCEALCVSLAHHALDIRAELNRCLLHGSAVLVEDDDAVHTGIVRRNALISDALFRTQPGRDAVGFGFRFAGKKAVNGRLIDIDHFALDRFADDHTVSVDKERGGEGINIEEIINILRGNKHRIGNAVFRQDFFPQLQSLRVVSVKQQAHDGAVLISKAAADAGRLTVLNVPEWAHQQSIQLVLHRSKVVTPQIDGLLEELAAALDAALADRL